MVVSIKIDVSQIDDFSRKMEALNTKLIQEVHEGLHIGAQLIKADAQTECPYRKGFLRSTIYAVAKQTWSFAIGAWAPYAKYQEYGTRHIPKASGSRARLHFISDAIKRRWPQVRDLIRRAIIIAKMEAER